MVSTIRKNAQGYGYKYTDLAEIHNYLESQGRTYYQYIDVVDGNDYIMTVLVDSEGKESAPIRGCRVVQATLTGKSNPAQEQGSALTYARRYSLLLCLGLATVDSDAEELTRQPRETLISNLLSLSEIKGVSVEEICKMGGVSDIADLTDDRLDGAIKWLSRR